MNDVFANLQAVMAKLMTILLNPTTNLTAAFLLYGIIALVLILLLVIGVMVLMGGPEDEEPSPEVAPVVDEDFEHLEEGEVYEGRDTDEPTASEVAAPKALATKKVKTPVPPMTTRGRLVVASVAVLVVAFAWVGTGYTTSDPAVCNGCHLKALQHAKAAAGTDPHAKVSCVACHEPGGVFGRYVSGVPSRLIHFASQAGSSTPDEYGAVTASACSTCHASGLAAVATNKTRGLKISHKEPIAASATCLDCHAMNAGVVATYNAGMGPCLRCHDGKKASATCATCHDQKVATAARVRTTSFAIEQIPEVTCGGCHDEKKQCDTCHGIRMPHTKIFMAYAHARAGAVDYWYNGGKTCARCHTATRNPCTKCHSKIMGRAHGVSSSLPVAHRRAAESACNTCHGQWAYQKNRDFCKDLCHSPEAIANSPR